MKHHPFDFDKPSPKQPFELPEGYFEQFASRIEQEIAPKRVSPLKITRPILYAAAVFGGIVLLGIAAFRVATPTETETPPVQAVTTNDEAKQIILDEVSEDAMIDYILANADY